MANKLPTFEEFLAQHPEQGDQLPTFEELLAKPRPVEEIEADIHTPGSKYIPTKEEFLQVRAHNKNRPLGSKIAGAVQSFGEAIPEAFNAMGASLGRGAADVWGSLVDDPAGGIEMLPNRLLATGVESAAQGVAGIRQPFAGFLDALNDSHAGDVMDATVQTLAGQEHKAPTSDEKDQTRYEHFVERLREKRVLEAASEGHETLFPSQVYGQGQPFKNLAAFGANFVDPAAPGTLLAGAVARKLATGAVAKAAGPSLVSRAASKVGGGLERAGAGIKDVVGVPASLAGASGLPAAGLGMAANAIGIPTAAINTAIKGARTVGAGVQATGEAVSGLARTVPGGTVSRLQQIVRDEAAPDWLRATALRLEKLGVGEAASSVAGIAKAAGSGAAIGGFLGAFGSETAEEWGASAGSGAALGATVHTLASPLHSAQAARARDDADALRWFNRRDPQERQEIKNLGWTREQVLQAARAETLLNGLVPGQNVQFRYLSRHEYEAKYGVGRGAMSTLSNGRPTIDINTEPRSSGATVRTVGHELFHALRTIDALSDSGGLATKLVDTVDSSGRVVRKGLLTVAEFDKRAAEYAALRQAQGGAVMNLKDPATRAHLMEEVGAELFANLFSDSADIGKTSSGLVRRVLDHFLLLDSASFGARLGKRLAARVGDGVTSTSDLMPGLQGDAGVYAQLRELVRKQVDNTKKFEFGETENAGITVNPSETQIVGNEHLVDMFPDNDNFQRDPNSLRPDRILMNGSRPVLLTETGVRRVQAARANAMTAALAAVPDVGQPGIVRLNANGSFEGRAFSNDQLTALNAIPDHVLTPSMKAKINELNALMTAGDGTAIAINYNAALRRGKYSSNISAEWRVGVPLSVHISKAGNFYYQSLDLTAFNRKLERWTTSKPRAFDDFGGKQDFLNSVSVYLQNHLRGHQGREGLDADPAKALRKANRINDFFNVRDIASEGLNPDRLSSKGAKDNLIRARRFDRINRVEQAAGDKFPIDYALLKQNHSPEWSAESTPEEILQNAERSAAPGSATTAPRPIAFSPEVAGAQLKGEPLDFAVGDVALNLIHYSGQQALKQLKPKFFGSGSATSGDLRGLPKSFLFVEGSEMEADGQLFGNKNVYSATVSGTRLYDLRAGAPDTLRYYKEINREKADAALIRKGYAGLLVSTSDGRNVVMLYKPVTLEARGVGLGGETATPNLRPEKRASIAALAAEATAKPASEGGGGITYNISRDKNLGGEQFYSVAIFPDRTMTVKGFATADQISEFIAKNFDLLHIKDHSLGTWFDAKKGVTDIDVATTVPDRSEAVALGEHFNQKAVFDLSIFEEIPTGGTGDPIPGLGPVKGRLDRFRESRRPVVPEAPPTPVSKANSDVQSGAEGYAKAAGIDYVPHKANAKIDPALGSKLADAYDAMKHTPKDPAVVRAYKALADEVKAQWLYVRDVMGIMMVPWKGPHEPYRSSAQMRTDVSVNKHLWYKPTDTGYGEKATEGQDHPLLADSGIVEDGENRVVNDLFRPVHDIFGHAKDGSEFGPRGEYNAFLSHASMFTPEAIKALASETLGQNAWVNFGKHLKDNPKFADPKKRPFAEQKAGLLPDLLVAEALESGRTQFSPEAPAEAEDMHLRVGTRNPSATRAVETGHSHDTVISVAAMRQDPKLVAKARSLIREYYPQSLPGKDPIGNLTRHMADNLTWLYNQVPEEIRTRSRLWYDGARQISVDWGKKYGVAQHAVAGAIASLSPQRDWFMNLSQAERVLEVVKNTPLEGRASPEMGYVLARWIHRTKAEFGADALSDKTRQSISESLSEINSRHFSELTTWQKAVWVRAYSEAHLDPHFDTWSPEGRRVGITRKDDGTPVRNQWGSFETIGSAVSILLNPSKENISEQLGTMHKVRNFYNNILLPNDPRFGDVTIDTHAVAAALLKPLGGSDPEVGQNLGDGSGSSQSSVLGIHGLYPVFADAYRLAAKELGVLPRELQSITWEAIRGMFTTAWKRAGNKKLVNDLWAKYASGETLLIDETRNKIRDLAGGIRPPQWAKYNDSTHGPHRHSTDPGQLFSPRVLGERPPDRGGGDRVDAAGDGEAVPGTHFSPEAAFYSRINRTVEESTQSKASGAQWKALIRNSKLGFPQAEWDLRMIASPNDLESGTAYTKAEVLEFLKANEIVVKDVTLGAATMDNPEYAKAANALTAAGAVVEGFARQYEAMKADNREAEWTAELRNATAKAVDRETRAANRVAALETAHTQKTKTHFATYQLPGAKEGSYREVLLTVPGRTVPAIAAKARTYDEALVLWKEEAKAGLRGIFDKGEIESQSVENIRDILSEYVDGVPAREEVWRDGHSQYSDIANPVVRLRFNERTDSNGERMLFLEEVQAPQKGEFEKMPALFQKNWREVAFKWALRHASENGFDSVGWTTGEQQAARYDISKQVESIVYAPTQDTGMARRKGLVKSVVVRPKEGAPINLYIDDVGIIKEHTGSHRQEFGGKPLGAVIGKETAARIINDASNREVKITGDDLKIGGHGLAKLYDVDFRNVVNSLPAVKKAGQKVGAAEVHGGEKYDLIEEPSGVGNTFVIKNRDTGKYLADSSQETWANRREDGELMSESVARKLSSQFARVGEKATVHSVPITPTIRESVMGGQAQFSPEATPEKLKGLRTVVLRRGGGFDVSSSVKGVRVGSMQLGYERDYKTATVKAVDVDEEYLRRGIATKLYQEAKRELMRRGVTTLRGALEGSGPVQLREKVFGSGNTKYFSGGAEIPAEEAVKVMDVGFGYVLAETKLPQDTYQKSR